MGLEGREGASSSSGPDGGSLWVSFPRGLESRTLPSPGLAAQSGARKRQHLVQQRAWRAWQDGRAGWPLCWERGLFPWSADSMSITSLSKL